jgi:hypothetical protein
VGDEDEGLPAVSPTPDRTERGLALIFVALLMIVMLIFAAFAIDVGALYNYRREDQNAADGAALAAAQDLGQSTATVVATAKAYVHDTLGVTFSAAQWNSCGADGGSLANLAPGSNCVSYSTDQVRVRVPDQHYRTAFAGVVGADQWRHSAFAVAGISPEGFGGVLPFGVTGTSASGGYGCLQSNSNGQASAVCGSITGNFRFLDFGHFGSAAFNTPTDCGNGNQGPRIEQNVAMGVDHELSRIDGSPHNGNQVIDTEACEPPQVLSPNAVWTRTGNQSNEATVGLLTGDDDEFFDGDPARLRRSDPNLFNGAAPARATVLGVDNLDNVPLWAFIPPDSQTSGLNIPASCRRSQFVDGSGNFSITNTPTEVQNFLSGRTPGDQSLALLQRCIQHYMGQAWTGGPIGVTAAESPSGCTGTCDDPVFGLNSVDQDPELFDIQYTPRFGYVPELDGFGSGNSVSRIVRFRAIYIQRLFIENDGVTWDAGIPCGCASGNVERVGETTIFVFPENILPNGLADDNAPFQLGANRFVRLIR